MPGRYRQTKESNRSRFYILLSIIFVIVMFKWGLPLFMSIFAGQPGIKQTQDKDIIPPQTPIIAALPEATNSSSVLVDGYTESEAQLELIVNDSLNISDTTKQDGSFSLIAQLIAGDNRIQVKARDEAGNFSTSEIIIVKYDNVPVEVTIFSPKEGSEYFGKNNRIIDINGETNKLDSQVTINNSFVQVSKDASFTHRYQLADGENVIKVVVSDKAGNTAEKELKINYTP